MGGPNEVLLGGCASAAAVAACDAAVAEVERIESKYSRYRTDSALSHLNAAAGQGWVSVDEETRQLLDYADACYRASSGLFDITSGVLRRAWDFSGRQGPPCLPDPSLLAQLVRRVGWERVERRGERVRLARETELDLGGIAKEYAVDRVCALLWSLGVRHALVNLGGDTRVFGGQPTPSGQTAPWRIGVAHPRNEGAVLGTVALTDGAVASSGDYERYVEIEGRRFCHVLNPRTGMSVSYWQSVTVVAPVCVSAGSASTIAMLLEAHAGAFLQEQAQSFLAVSAQSTLRGGLFDPPQLDS